MSIIISELTFNKTNVVPFEIDLKESDPPLAPLVFAENLPESNSFRLRIVAFVPSDITFPPSFVVVNDGNPIKVCIAGGKEVQARSFCVVYDDTASQSKLYTLWSIIVEYSLQDVPSVDYIITRVMNIDPKTSRGTVTTVQEA